MQGSFRVQMRAMVAAINANFGAYTTVPEIKHSFVYYGGSHSFAKFFDTALEKYPRHIEIIYDRAPGWYTSVIVHVKKEIISNL